MHDKTTTIDELKVLLKKFREERGWEKHMTPRNLSASIAIEAGELLELYQWGEYEKSDRDKDIGQELADIVIYCLHFAITENIDLTEAIEQKMKKVAKKYPIEVFNADSDDPEAYWEIKKKHRTDG